MSGPDTDEFHAVVTEQIEANRQSIDRLSEENRLLRDAIGRLIGKPPKADDPGDELAAARRRKRERGAHRHAGFIALPIALGALLARAVMHARTAAPLARIAWAAAAAVTAGAIVGGTAYVVTHAPEHHVRRDSSVTSPAPSHHAPGRSLTPIPRSGRGKGAAARLSTRRQHTPLAAVPRSRAAAPQVSSVTVPGITQHVTPPTALPTTLPTVLPTTVPPLPTPTVTIPTPLPSVTKAIGHLVCHLNLLGIRVCVKG